MIDDVSSPGGDPNDPYAMHGRVAVVTGASSGLGASIAEGLARVGANVVLASRRAGALQQVADSVQRHGAESLCVPADVGVVEDCRRVIDEAVSYFGRVDVLVNCAGIGTIVPAVKERPDDFETVLRTNLFGTYWMSQAAAQVMRPGSSIVNVASILASVASGMPQAAYSSSKAGVVGLTRDLAEQWTSRLGIRVNSVSPGFVRTEMNTEFFDRGVFERTQLPLIPAGRAGSALEIALAVAFLASDAASYITGHDLVVDGGRSLF